MTDEERHALIVLRDHGWNIRTQPNGPVDHMVVMSPALQKQIPPNRCAIQLHGTWWTFDQLRELTRDV